MHPGSEGAHAGSEEIFSILKQMRLEKDSLNSIQEERMQMILLLGLIHIWMMLAVWMLRSLSESSVACITGGDFAMQNVLLQMGLRVLAPGGMHICQLHRHIGDAYILLTNDDIFLHVSKLCIVIN